MMRTGLEADIGRRPFGRRSGLRQRNRLGMGPSAGMGIPPPDNPPLIDDDTTNRRIGPRPAQPPTPKRKRQSQKPGILRTHGSSGSSVTPGRNSLTNLSKSSAAWKFL